MLGSGLALIWTFGFTFGCSLGASAADDGVASFVQTLVVRNTLGHGSVVSAAEPHDPSGLLCSVILVVLLVPLLALPLCLGGAQALRTPGTPAPESTQGLRAQAADLRQRAAALCSEASHTFAQHQYALPSTASKPPAAPSGSTFSVVKRLFHQTGPLLPYVMLTALSLSILDANQGWIRLNFFARSHAPLPAEAVHCEITPSKYYCRAALEDKAGASVILSFVPPVVHLLLAPALGAMSDARGRRCVLTTCQVLSVLPILFTVLSVYLGVTLYIAFAMSPLAQLPLEALCLAWVTDRVAQQADIMGAFGLLMAAKYSSYLVGWVLGNVFSIKLASILSLLACVLATAYAVMILPESLPAKKRKNLERPLTMPGVGLRVLGRTSVTIRLALVLAVALFCDKGFAEVSQEYLEMYAIDWTKDVGNLSIILEQVSAILWFCCLGGLAHIFGAFGTAAFARWAAILYVVSSVVAQEKWHVGLVHFVFAGPLMLTFPVLAASCSTLVAQSEQGLMQGCVGAVASIAECIGPYIFFLVFDSSRRQPKQTLGANSIVILHLVCSVLALGLLVTLRWYSQRQQKLDTEEEKQQTPSAVPK
mmetsp:Transcript_5022/g.14684  ORF Transcript_5022/g.14684 Transcript_5022/m.14684 type:complete len:593 (+) Transcript_5022:103-1881(+)